MSAERSVVAAVIVRAGRVLVQTRASPERWAGYWEFPGGGVEPGESAEMALARECREELGLTVQVGAQLHEVHWTHGERHVHVRFFRCESDSDAQPRPLLGQELRWVGGPELQTLKTLPANVSLVELLAARLS